MAVPVGFLHPRLLSQPQFEVVRASCKNIDINSSVVVVSPSWLPKISCCICIQKGREGKGKEEKENGRTEKEKKREILFYQLVSGHLVGRYKR